MCVPVAGPSQVGCAARGTGDWRPALRMQVDPLSRTRPTLTRRQTEPQPSALTILARTQQIDGSGRGGTRHIVREASMRTLEIEELPALGR